MTALEIRLARDLANILPLAERYARETGDDAILKVPLARAREALRMFRQESKRDISVKQRAAKRIRETLLK